MHWELYGPEAEISDQMLVLTLPGDMKSMVILVSSYVQASHASLIHATV